MLIFTLFSRQNWMIAQDKMEKERSDAKNALEEYVYDMRDRVSDQLEKFVTEKVRDTHSLLVLFSVRPSVHSFPPSLHSTLPVYQLHLETREDLLTFIHEIPNTVFGLRLPTIRIFPSSAKTLYSAQRLFSKIMSIRIRCLATSLIRRL